MLISVIIPTFNRARLLARAVTSVLQQTGVELEVIIIDDASTDDTEQVVSQMHDSRLRYVRLEKNSGACMARNVGIATAQGELLAFQDSDDVWMPEKLQRQLNVMQETGADIVFCSFERFSPTGESLGRFPHADVQPGQISYEQLLLENLVSTQTILGRKTCFEQFPFSPQMPRLQDWELMLRMVQHFHVHYMNETLVHLCEQKDSISGCPEKAVAALHILCNIHRETLEKNENLMMRMLITLEAAYHDCNLPAWPLYIKALSAQRAVRTNLFCLYRAAVSAIKGYKRA